ncbi:MAG: exopolysaccharide biosynthesis polyprenyl glycosylphosphotransferase [Cyclobacteriaceae bacterium]|nr:exopolysaccharide biosynthesis polyprenyl glycosylphosphotransferase [Cyclobacteriaceae bacterium]
MTPLLKFLFLSIDIILLNIAIYLSFAFYNENFILLESSNAIYLLLFGNLGWIFLVLVSNPYSVNKSWTVTKIFRNQVAFVFIHLLVVVSLIFFLNRSYSLNEVILVFIIFLPGFFLNKIFLIYVRRFFVGKISRRNYVIIGRNRLSEDIRRHFLINYQEGYRFFGYLNYQDSEYVFNQLRHINDTNELHEIFYCIEGASTHDLKRLVDFGLDSLIKVKVLISNLNAEQSTLKGNFDFIPALDLAVLPMDDTRNQILKRIIDLLFSIAFLILIFSWLLPIIALLIKLDSKGPLFFIQPRSGLKNKPFDCLKFRSMTFDRNADFLQAKRNDPRITRVGKFLRKSSIDELPQFINVLKGDMSIIGPRPHPIKLNEKFEPLIANIMSRHYVKPGITGLAQCMGYRGETQTLADMENRVRLDRYYIENWSFWLDIKIIFLTIVSLIRGSDKAY